MAPKQEFKDRNDFKIGDLVGCEVMCSGYVRIRRGDFIDRVFHLREIIPVLEAAVIRHNGYATQPWPPPIWGPSVLTEVIPVQLAENEVRGTKR